MKSQLGRAHRRLYALFAVLWILACDPRSKDSAQQSQSPDKDQANNLQRPDYPQVYCQALAKLKLKQNQSLSENISHFCQNGQATDKLRSYVQAATNAPDDPKQQTTIYIDKSVDTPDGWSDFVYIWAFSAPMKPSDLKDRPITATLSKGYQSKTIQLTTKATDLGPDALDGTGLHLKGYRLEYSLQITGENGFKADHTRTTEFNIYQVGDSEMGFSEEHLIDAQNPNYQVSTMLNLSIKDGRPEKMASIIVNLVNIKLFNQGSPSIAQSTTADISRYLAESMYQALR